jgi:hypothetical protein
LKKKGLLFIKNTADVFIECEKLVKIYKCKRKIELLFQDSLMLKTTALDKNEMAR